MHKKYREPRHEKILGARGGSLQHKDTLLLFKIMMPLHHYERSVSAFKGMLFLLRECKFVNPLPLVSSYPTYYRKLIPISPSLSSHATHTGINS